MNWNMDKQDDRASKSHFLLQRAEELVNNASDYGVDLIVCGGLAIHMLSDFLGAQSPRPWNHKDIDFIVPLSQLSKAIAFFKNLEYTRVFAPYKKQRLAKNHIRFANIIDEKKILVDLYGQSRVPVVKIERNNSKIMLLSPRIELENWLDRRRRLGSKPSIDLSIELLKNIVNKNLFQENKLC